MLVLSQNETLAGHKLLILSPWKTPDGYVDRLRAQYPDLKVAVRLLDWTSRKLTEECPQEEWKDVTILLTGSCLPEPDWAPKMQLVQLVSAGANHVVKHPLFSDTNVDFCTTNGVHGPQISEWIMCTYLAMQHHIPRYLKLQEEGKWARSHEMSRDQAGRTVGILGYGSIGRQFARVATAMGMTIHAYTLHPRSTPESRKDDSYHPPGLGDPDGLFPSKWFSGGSTGELHEFLSSGLDLLVISLPLTDKTRHLISAPEFRVLSGRKTFVSNIARGPIVKTPDLIDALESGMISGAAVDVTDPEPLPPGHPLWSTRNLIITPHMSGISESLGERVLEVLSLNLSRLSQGKPLVNRVNRREGY